MSEKIEALGVGRDETQEEKELRLEYLQSGWKIVDTLRQLLRGNTGQDHIKDSTAVWLELEIASAIRDGVGFALSRQAVDRYSIIEECAKIADYPGFFEAQDSDYDIGFNTAKTEIGKRIRALKSAAKEK